MADDLLGLGKVCEAIEKGTREIRELAKTHYEPIAKAKGELKADRIKVEGEVQLLKTIVEADRQLQEAGITKRVLNRKLVIPLLEHASLETDEELTTKWAGLLASSASGSSVHVSFPGVLADLTSVEVRILDELYQRRITSEALPDGMERSDITMYALMTRLGFSKEEFLIPVDNLVRLRLCWTDSAWDPYVVLRRETQISLNLTPFGKEFVAACKGPSRNTTSNETLS